MTHLIRGSISAWDCSHFIEEKEEAHEDLQCKKGYDVCEGRSCSDFEERRVKGETET